MQRSQLITLVQPDQGRHGIDQVAAKAQASAGAVKELSPHRRVTGQFVLSDARRCERL